MSYIDPDALHGAMNDLNTAITDHAATLTANGLTPATLQARLKSLSDDLGGKKGVRDLKKADLATAQQNFATSATANYKTFSDLIDAVAGSLGKSTPAGDRVTAIRVRLNAPVQHHATSAAAKAKPV
jgi:hypothetical protein